MKNPRGHWVEIAKKAPKGTDFILPYPAKRPTWAEHPLKTALWRLGIPMSTRRFTETHFILTTKGQYYEPRSVGAVETSEKHV